MNFSVVNGKTFKIEGVRVFEHEKYTRLVISFNTRDFYLQTHEGIGDSVKLTFSNDEDIASIEIIGGECYRLYDNFDKDCCHLMWEHWGG